MQYLTESPSLKIRASFRPYGFRFAGVILDPPPMAAEYILCGQGSRPHCLVMPCSMILSYRRRKQQPNQQCKFNSRHRRGNSILLQFGQYIRDALSFR